MDRRGERRSQAAHQSEDGSTSDTPEEAEHDTVSVTSSVATQIHTDMSEEANREVRDKYRGLLQDMQERVDTAGEERVDISVLSSLVLEANNAFSEVKRPREAVMDAKILKTCGELAKMHIEAAQSNLNVFSPAEFAQKLIIFMNPDGDRECDINEIERPLDFASWKRFGHAVAPLFKRAIGVTNVAAGIGFEQPKPTPKARKTPLDKEVAEKKKPTEIVAPASGEERQTQEVNRIYKVLKARFQENRCQPLDFFSFVINPHSFSLSIENMFHMSFLVRDQFARVTEDKHGIPVISPQKRGDSSHSRDDVSHQCIMSISKEEWRDIVDTFKIKEPMIPPPANREGKRKSSGEVM